MTKNILTILSIMCFGSFAISCHNQNTTKKEQIETDVHNTYNTDTIDYHLIYDDYYDYLYE